MPTIDDSRAEFIEAFKAYAQAGNAMRDLLLSRDSIRDDNEVSRLVTAQQHLLNEARDRYQTARNVYVREIMKLLGVSPIQASDAEPILEIRPPVTGPH